MRHFCAAITELNYLLPPKDAITFIIVYHLSYYRSTEVINIEVPFLCRSIKVYSHLPRYNVINFNAAYTVSLSLIINAYVRLNSTPKMYTYKEEHKLYSTSFKSLLNFSLKKNALCVIIFG